jgi:hypothetical protein
MGCTNSLSRVGIVGLVLEAVSTASQVGGSGHVEVDTQFHHRCERGITSAETASGGVEERLNRKPEGLPVPIISNDRDRSVKGLAPLGPWWTALRAALD